MNVMTLMTSFRGHSSTRGPGDVDRRSTSDVSADGGTDRGNGDRRPGLSRLLPGFVPGGWKRNVVVGLGYLLGALALLGALQFLIELLL